MSNHSRDTSGVSCPVPTSPGWWRLFRRRWSGPYRSSMDAGNPLDATTEDPTIVYLTVADIEQEAWREWE